MDRQRMIKKMEFPPGYCAALCKYTNTNACAEACLPYRDMNWFEPKTTEILDLPPFPYQEFMEVFNGDERKAFVGLYFAAITAALQGVPARPYVRQRSVGVPEPVQVSGVQPAHPTAVTIYQSVGEKVGGEGV